MNTKIELWCPWAKKVEPPLPTKGRYASDYPIGAVVHYTAGGYGLSELDLARQMGHTYFLIDEYGGIHQGFPLDRWGSHAGVSSWKGLTGNVSRYLVGIEVDCAGILKADGPGMFKTWWGQSIEREKVRVVASQANRTAGAYHMYTPEQEKSLVNLIVWLKGNNPSVFNLDLVLGHDEVSPGRKQDPGGSLSVTMPQLRTKLEHEYERQSSFDYLIA